MPGEWGRMERLLQAARGSERVQLQLPMDGSPRLYWCVIWPRAVPGQVRRGHLRHDLRLTFVVLWLEFEVLGRLLPG